MEALSDLRSSLEEYARLSAGARATVADAQLKELAERIDKDQSAISWADVALVNLCIVARLELDAVRVKLGAWRLRMRDVVGDKSFAAYLVQAPDLRNGSEAALRADLIECIRAVFYFYTAYGVGAGSRASISKLLFISALAILLLESLLALLISWHQHGVAVINLGTSVTPNFRTVFGWLLATSAAAVVGSVISVQRRLQDPSVGGDPFYRYIQTTYDRFGVAIVSPIFGAIFGMVIYALLVTNLINIKLVSLTNGIPGDATAQAMLLLFGFLAGFAEQLVPDALSRIAARALGSVDSGPPVPGAMALPIPVAAEESAGRSALPAANSGAGAQPGAASSPTPNAATPPQTTLASTPTDVTPEATALAQDPSLASEASPEDLKKGVA